MWLVLATLLFYSYGTYSVLADMTRIDGGSDVSLDVSQAYDSQTKCFGCFYSNHVCDREKYKLAYLLT